jgi:hypothetical protein
MIEHTVTLESVPTTLDAFIALRDRHARTPEGGAAMFALALIVYARDPDVGADCVLVSVRADLLDDDPSGYRGKRLRRARTIDLASRVGAKPHIARSYAQGTLPHSGYALGDGPVTFRVRQQKNSVESETRAKMFLWSTGADTPRPVALERNDKGLWKAFEWSSLEVDVRQPAPPPSDDL